MESGAPIINKPGKQMTVPGSEVQGGLAVKPVDAKGEPSDVRHPDPPDDDPTVEVPDPPGEPDGDEGDTAEQPDDGRPRRRRR